MSNNETDSTDSLIATLKERLDTCFNGDEITWSNNYSDNRSDVIQDATGTHYLNPHDHVEFKVIDGERVAVFVGDFDGSNCMDHEYDHLPHGIGLYVKEGYRRQGIASELIDSFMKQATADTYVSDPPFSAALFHIQTDWDVIYLGQIKYGRDPSHPPLFELDLSSSPTYSIPFFTAYSDAQHEFVKQCHENDVPAVYMTVFSDVRELRYPVPDAHELGGDEETNVYIGRDFDTNVCAVNVTDESINRRNDIISKLNDVVQTLNITHQHNGNSLWGVHDGMLTPNWGKYNAPRTRTIEPDAARIIADEAYELITNEFNFTGI